MGVGPNFVLDKGHKATGTTAYRQFEIVTPVNAGLDIARAITPSTLAPYYVVQEDLDAIRLATGKAIINARVMGISRVIAGAAVPLWSRVVPDGSARAIAQSKAAAGAAPTLCLGIALTAATQAEQQIDVLLVPGLMY